MEHLNKDWIDMPHDIEKYKKGVESFLDFAFHNITMEIEGDEEPKILCPCEKCVNRYWFTREAVYNHLIVHKFNKKYKVWNFHGEGLTAGSSKQGGQFAMQSTYDDMSGMMHDVFRNVIEGSTSSREEEVHQGPDENAKKFYKLVEEAQEELFPGCKKFSVLSFTIRLYLLKCVNGWSNSSFTDLMKTLREAFPSAKIPASFEHAKKMVKNLGLDYKKIDACPNDCMLYWKDHEKDKYCHVCKVSRWKLDDKQKEEGIFPDRGVPAKVLRHFPLKPRLQRLFMSSNTAGLMTWHEIDRPKDGKLRHPADGKAWKDFDEMHPDFASDPRNVRLSLTSDGFNPFRTMSVSYSVWPVFLSVYNLPPWLSNKAEYTLMSLIIPGPHSPGYDIDVYLQPLIEELQELWEVGINTFDALKNETFTLRATLLWTISDFPAYAMLSGWSTKGEFACPCCNHETCSKYLKYSKKTCYMGHRRFLKEDHPWRRNKSAFDGKVETRPPPTTLSGSDVLAELVGFENKFGKTQKKGKKKCPWKKKSIFFNLPYWKTNSLRHNLDVMHIEKNICDSLLGTLLEIPGKTKDHVGARLDLQAMGIRKDLHPKKSGNSTKVSLSKACFSMSSEEKNLFCSVIKGAKFPDGCASNISRCVQMSEKKISGYKSHDAHFILHYLLQVGVRKTLPKQVAITLIRMGSFFRNLCSKVIEPKDLDYLQSEIVDILCHLEKIFVPSFFDIMVHLSIHLVHEVSLGGAVQSRWMFLKEMFLGKLKSYVRNRCRPEGSIAEGYLAEEGLIFCSRYLHDDFSSKLNRPSRNCDDDSTFREEGLFPDIGRPLGGKKRNRGKKIHLEDKIWELTHRYILFNCDQINDYISEHQDLVNTTRSRGKRNRWAIAQNHSHDIVKWFENRVKNENVSSEIKALSRGPDYVARSFKGYIINGYKFCTVSRDAKRKTQCSGVSLKALTPSFASSRDRNPITGNVTYYGAVQEIMELDYFGHFKVVLFHCKWFQAEQDEYGLTRVNFSSLCSTTDPFVMASQVHQVFYVADPIEKDIHYVMKAMPRDFFDIDQDSDESITSSYWDEPTNGSDRFMTSTPVNDLNVTWLRDDLPATTVEIPSHVLATEPAPEHDLSDDEVVDDTIWDFIPNF